jgi:Gpi18-like mannosyltransferase
LPITTPYKGAGILYACYPEAIVSERSIFLEPFINFAAVFALLLYKPSLKSWLPIGLFLAFAVSIKVTAIVWIPPFALLAWHSGRVRDLGTMVAGGILGFVVFLLP